MALRGEPVERENCSARAPEGRVYFERRER